PTAVRTPGAPPTYPERVLRTAIKPKWLALLVLAALIAIAFVQLGRWQLGVAHDRARAAAIEAAGKEPAVEVTTLLVPHAQFPPAASGRMVTARGTYVAGQVLVTSRLLSGVTGYWVITPLRLRDSGAIFPVLRGWSQEPILPDPPAGEVVVTASLAPGESPTEGSYPADQLGSVDLSILVNRWPGDLYNAFGFAQREQRGATAMDPAPLTHVPPPRPDTGLNGRNAAYALQWWVFAAFALVMWVKMVQADHRGVGTRPPVPTIERTGASKQD
ncbi:MAG: SURF1 family protein, partial [Nostocoides sp.]